MSKIMAFMMVSLFSLTSFVCYSQNNETENKENSVDEQKIEVYYFHLTRRCATCNAVEDVTKEALNEYFPKEMEDGTIVFQSINLEDADSESTANRLKVSVQSLLFVSGDNQVNLTNDGFMYAKVSPDRLKKKVKATVKKLQQ